MKKKIILKKKKNIKTDNTVQDNVSAELNKFNHQDFQLEIQKP